MSQGLWFVRLNAVRSSYNPNGTWLSPISQVRSVTYVSGPDI
jgi:hypothetical protein